MAATFKCFECDRVFENSWPEADARAEFEANFPNDDLQGAQVVCDDCYAAILENMARQGGGAGAMNDAEWKWP